MRHLPSKTRVAIDALAAEIPKMIGVRERMAGSGERLPITDTRNQ
jgi:hypothetical protein